MGTAVIPETLQMFSDEILSNSLEYLSADPSRLVVSIVTSNKKAPSEVLVVYGTSTILPSSEVLQEIYKESEKLKTPLLLSKARAILDLVDMFCEGQLDQNQIIPAISRSASIREKDDVMLTYNWLHIQDATNGTEDITAYGYLFYPKQTVN